MMNNIVFAEDIEVITVSDPGTWSAFKFFELYGYTSDFQTTEEQVYTTSGTTTFTGNFSFTGTFSGSFDATVELAVDTLIGTELADVDNILSGYTHYYLDKDEVQLTIHPTDNATQQNNGFSFGCVYNAQSTSTNSTMTCTPTSGLAQTIILPDQEITIDSIDTLFNSVTNYSIALTLRNEGTIVGNIDGTLSGIIGGSGNVSLSGVYNETTETTNKQSYKFTMPYMTNKSGKWTLLSGGYQNSFSLKGENDETYVIAFLSKSFPFESQIQIYDLFDRPYEHPISSNYVKRRNTKIIGYNSALGTLFINCIEYKNYNDKQVILNPINNSIQALDIYPLYFGRLSQMSDEMFRFIYGQDRLIEFLEHGNNQSQAAANGMNQVEQDFVGKTDELIDFEGDTFNSMDSAIDGVQLNNNLISGSGFLNAANWVRVQFDNLISYSPLSSILVFSLSLGFALLIIGKVR